MEKKKTRRNPSKGVKISSFKSKRNTGVSKTKVRFNTSQKEEDERQERDKYNFNEGRLVGDTKWIDAIDERIKELEEKVGIPELRKLKKETMYKWQ